MAVVKLSSIIEGSTQGDGELLALVERQRNAFIADGPPSYKQRKAALDKLQHLVFDRKEEIVEAIVNARITADTSKHHAAVVFAGGLLK